MPRNACTLDATRMLMAPWRLGRYILDPGVFPEKWARSHFRAGRCRLSQQGLLPFFFERCNFL